LRSTESIIASVEFKRIAGRHGRQLIIQGICIGDTSGLNGCGCGFGLQALKLLVAELEAD